MPKLKEILTATWLILVMIVMMMVVLTLNISVSQAESVMGGTITRSEVLARAQYWVDIGVKYNLTRQSGTLQPDREGGHRYGPDCSGLVSMAWHLEPGSFGGLNTGGLQRFMENNHG